MLVCDVGGGTTDFSLIAVAERDGELTLERVAVGEHILLGGDNMDLALARLLQQRLESGRPQGRHLAAARPLASGRLAKEALLSDPADTERPVTLLGRGSQLIGGTITTTLTRDDVNQMLLDGFFPAVASERDAGAAAARRPAGDRPALRRRPRRHPAPRAVPARPGRRRQPAPRRSAAGRAAWPVRRTCCSTAA